MVGSNSFSRGKKRKEKEEKKKKRKHIFEALQGI
jgi:hypothetical protein